MSTAWSVTLGQRGTKSASSQPLMYGFAIDNWWRWIGSSYFVFDVISRKWSIRTAPRHTVPPNSCLVCVWSPREDYVRLLVWFVLIDDESPRRTCLSITAALFAPACGATSAMYRCRVSALYSLGKYWQSSMRELLQARSSCRLWFEL